MANENMETFGASFELDTSDLKNGINEANRYIRTAESAFKAASSGMDDWTKSEEGLNARIKASKAQISAQSKVVDALQKEYEDLKNSADATASEIQAAAIKFNNATAKLNKFKREAEDAEKALKNLDVSSTTSKLKSLENAASSAASKIGTLGKKLSSDLAGGLKAGVVGLAAGVGGLVASMFSLVDAQQENVENFGKLDTAFEDAGLSAEDAREQYENFYSLVGDSDQATEAAQNLARLTTDQEELAQWTDISAGAFATFGDALPIENLTETAQESAHTGQVVGSLADALNWSTKSTEDFSASMNGHDAAQSAFNEAIAEGATKEDAFNAALAACSDEQERASLITATLNGLYADAGREYRNTNSALLEYRESQAALNQDLASAATAVMPMQTALQNFASELLSGALPGVKQFGEGIRLLGTDSATAGTMMTEGIAGAIQGVLTNLTESLPQIVTAGTSILQGLLQGFTESIPSLTEAMVQLIPQLSTTLISMIPDLINAGLQLFLGLVQAVSQSIPDITQAIIDMIPELVQTLISMTPQIIEAGIELFKALAQSIPKVLSEIVKALGELIRNIGEEIVNHAPDLIQAGIDLMGGLIQGLLDSVGSILETIGNICGDILNGVLGFFGIASPSKKMRKVFGYVGEGMALGITDKIGDIEKAMDQVNETVESNVPSMDYDIMGSGGRGGKMRGSMTFIQNNYSPKALTPAETYRAGLKLSQTLAAGV